MDGSHTYTLAHNEFSDWSPEERATLTGFKAGYDESGVTVSLETGDLPDSVDWRNDGAVTPV